MTKKYVIVIKKEKKYNIVKCEKLALTMKVQESQCLLNFIEQEISDFLVDKILKNEEIPEGINDLEANLKGEPSTNYPHQIAFNLLPHIDSFLDFKKKE